MRGNPVSTASPGTVDYGTMRLILLCLLAWITLLSQPAGAQPSPAPSSPPVIHPNQEQDSPEDRFVLQGLKLTGNTVMSEEELTLWVCCYIGDLVGLADLEHIADLITDMYRAKGYTPPGPMFPSMMWPMASSRSLSWRES